MQVNSQLILVPTPISEDNVLESRAFQLINHRLDHFYESTYIVVEDLKPGRRRLLSYGFDRKIIDKIICLNEHNFKEMTQEILLKLQIGDVIFLMSDGGMPCINDPGQELVKLCHQKNIKVTSTPFYNSHILALALSGFKSDKFQCMGFLSRDELERKNELMMLEKVTMPTLILDTPYRLERTIKELIEVHQGKFSRQYFLALDLNQTKEELLTGNPNQWVPRLKGQKREFILIASPC